MKNPVLVATTGAEDSLGAVRLACRIAERQDRPLHVIAVLKPPLHTPDAMLGADQLPVDPAERAALHSSVLAQIETAGSNVAPAALEIQVDSPAAAIARRAAEIDAALVVVGLSRGDGVPGTPDHRPAGGTPLQVVRLAHAPVLAVPPEVTELPKRAVVAVDFSELSRDAARSAAAVCAPDGCVHLVHVTWSPPTNDWETEQIWLETYRIGAVARLEQLAGELSARAGIPVMTALLDGPAAAEILRYSTALAADLVVAGSHGPGFFGRLMMGSVARELLRDATSAVLIRPPREIAGGAGRAEPEAATADLAAEPF